MLWNQSRVLKSKAVHRYAHGGNDRIDAAGHRARVFRSMHAGAPEEAADAIDAVQELDRSLPGRWSEMFTNLLEGFILCAASLHPGDAFPIEPFRAHRGLPRRRDNARPALSLVASRPIVAPTMRATPRRRTDEHDMLSAEAGPLRSDRGTRLGAERWSVQWLHGCIARQWTSWRRRRQIKRAVAAFAEFDDRTLRDIGIPHRSQIEQVLTRRRDG
jgi:uncharacterized protein YjiS (DUF1127 family)